MSLSERYMLCVQRYCSVVERILNSGGDVELAKHLIEDAASALVERADEGITQTTWH
jgi:hypothetical protein